MNPSEWDKAIADVERATARLLAAMPANTPLIEDALARRSAALGILQSIAIPNDPESLVRLEKLVAAGASAQQQLLLAREQIRDSLVRLNQASYLTQAFSGKPADSLKAFDCEG